MAALYGRLGVRDNYSMNLRERYEPVNVDGSTISQLTFKKHFTTCNLN